MAINPKIKQKAEDIRKKIFGSEVRESLASGIEAISEDVEATIGRQDYVEEQFQNVIDETTDKDVISAPELIAARNGKSNLKTRLDDEHAQVTAQLQHTQGTKADKTNVRENTTHKPIDVDEFNTRTKALFTGGAVAVVEENAVGTENVKKKAIKPENTSYIDIFPSLNIEQGTIINGGIKQDTVDTWRIRTGVIIENPHGLTIARHNDYFTYALWYYSDGVYVGNSEGWQDLNVLNIPPGLDVMVTFNKKNGGLFTPTEIANMPEDFKITQAYKFANGYDVEKLYKEIEKKDNIYSFNDAWTSWLNGEKVPIAFFGDSTTDGNFTTGWTANTIGNDSTSFNAYPKLLENKIREITGNNVLRIYNAGFSGKTAQWGLENFESAFMGSSAYSDCKMIGISFGINDRALYQTEKKYREGFKKDVEGIINKCLENNIQPFLITTQAAIAPGVRTIDIGTHPLRDAQRIATIANEVKFELSNRYALEIIDVNKLTEEYLQFSQFPSKTITPDGLHFGDNGHEYEAGLMFSHIVPYTILVEDKTKIDWTSQRLFKGVPEDWVVSLTSYTGEFKTYVNNNKGNTTDTLIMSAYIFIKTKRQMYLKAYKNELATKTYVKVDGVVTQMDSIEKAIGNLDLGLHHLEVWTGEHEKADFKGFILD